MPLTSNAASRGRSESRRRRNAFLRGAEILEPRCLMAAALVRDINLTATQPANVTDVNGTAFYSGWISTDSDPVLALFAYAEGDVFGSGLKGFPETSTLGNFTPVGSELFFTVEDTVSGRSLWRSDGTQAGTIRLKDITPGKDDPTSVELIAVGTTLYFSAADGSGGSKLWKSDGTVAGTVLVKDMFPGATGTQPNQLTAVGSTVYFASHDATPDGEELWKSDGTAAGTVLVADVNPGQDSSNPYDLTPIGSTLFFTAYDSASLRRLWKTDGTAAGTVQVGPLGIVSSIPTAADGVIYLESYSPSSGQQLWRTDGTEAGTVDLLPLSNYPRDPHYTAAGSGLYFTHDDGIHGLELWHSDGTAAGTGMVADLNPGPGSSFPGNLTVVGPSLYFTAMDASNVVHLYRTDGTAAGTKSVTVLHNFDVGDYPPYNGDTLIRKAFQGDLYFVDNDPAYGRELFRTDGTTTGIVKDLAPGPDGVFPRELTVVGNSLVFAANDARKAAYLFRTDGTAAGTAAVNRFEVASTDGALTGTSTFARLGDVAIFLADDGIHGRELWRSDGTTAGTSMLANLNPYGGIVPTGPVLLNGYLYFGLTDSRTGVFGGLWRTDGTAAGTTRVRAFAGRGPEDLTVFNGSVYFSADDGSTGVELWKSDGTSSGTTLVRDLTNGATGSYPNQFEVVGSSLFFLTEAYVGTYQFGLWKTDGTSGGTAEVKHFSVPNGVFHFLSQLTAVGGTLFFIADDGMNEYGLWKSDGTADGTVLVKSINRNSASTFVLAPNELTAVGSTLFFAANENSDSSELWKSDGTAAGTVVVKVVDPTVPPRYGPSIIRDLTALNATTLLFTAVDDPHGDELWRSDGTTAGTVVVKDINPGPGDGLNRLAANGPNTVGQSLQLIDGLVYFTADDGVNGYGLYRTDGTAAGTVRFYADTFDGLVYRSAYPSVLAVLPAGILVAADGAQGTGFEPYLIDGTLANLPPVFNPVAVQTTRVNRFLSFPVTATDPNLGQTLSYLIESETTNDNFTATIDFRTGLVTFRASLAGTYQFRVDVLDNGSPVKSAGTTVTVHVSGAVADDFDGDGKSDLAVYRPSQALWIISKSSGGTSLTNFGDRDAGDLAAPGDYDGDGKSDLAVYRPSQALWIIRYSGGGTLFTRFGDAAAGDMAAPGDYDGDGKSDLAVYRRDAGLWIVRYSGGGTLVTTMGDPAAGDLAAAGDYDGDGKIDLAVYRPSQALWIISQSGGGTVLKYYGGKAAGDLAAPGDYDGDGKTDLAVFRPSQALWILGDSGGGTRVVRFGDPDAGDRAVEISPYSQARTIGHIFSGTSSARASFDLGFASNDVNVMSTPIVSVPRPSRVTSGSGTGVKSFGISGTET